MVMQKPQEYIDYLYKNLNPLEKFTDIFSGKDDRQDFTNILLFEMLKLMGGGGGGGYSGLSVRTVQVIANVPCRVLETVLPTVMADCQSANRIVAVVNNTLNVVVRFEVIGGLNNQPNNAFTIDEQSCPVNGSRAYLFKREQWFPYIAVKVTPLVAAPTSGTIEASIIIQE